MNNQPTPTYETYSALDRAFTFFNERLFDGRLPDAFITLHRKRNARGYFHAGQFVNRDGDTTIDEIALNPEHCGRTPKEVLSTLVHEMTHLQQQHEGKPSRQGYHNTEWATMMHTVGLTPTDTGAPGGKTTGQKVTHLIDEGGAFDVACDDFLRTDTTLDWFAITNPKAPKKKDLSKVKHTCPTCNARAWAKLGIVIICGECDERMEAEDMEENQ